MNFKHYKSTEFDAMGKEAARRLASHQYRDVYEKEKLELDKERHFVWTSVQRATGAMFNVATDGVESNVVAFIDTGTKAKYLNIAFLTRKNLKKALHGGRHECVHENGVCEDDFKEDVVLDKLRAMERKLGINGLVKTEDLFEGGTELVTEKIEHTPFHESGYGEQIRVVKALDVASKNMTGVSIVEEIGKGDSAKVTKTVDRMGDMVLMAEALEKMTPSMLKRWVGPCAITFEEVKTKLQERIENDSPPVDNAWQAGLALKKLAETLVAQSRVRRDLRRPATTLKTPVNF